MRARRALVDAATAETMAEVLRVREDLRQALLVQPDLLDQLRVSLQGTVDQSVMASRHCKNVVLHAGAYIRLRQQAMSDDHDRLVARVLDACSQVASSAARAAVADAVKASHARAVRMLWAGLTSGGLTAALLVGIFLLPLGR